MRTGHTPPAEPGASARSSMWEDLPRGRRTETDASQGEIVAMAGRHGVTAPVNARLVQLIRQAEASGATGRRTWPGDELWRDLAAFRG
ncbi:ketopantoate reductase C-terminal domain-containing protein [Streptomyces sp. NPDC004647]|uniref:ketopantoate reductase C-terminal domain-containing protein n=1 Tax=Streptomyces sp. NPDC004647 TaxID=3154671 RepID=UPI0033BDA56D